LEVDDARSLAGQFPAGQAVLGGERRGLPIPGFTLGNSPAEYTAQRVAGKTVVLSTTNGVRAMLHARQAENVFIAAFVNATAVLSRLLGRERVHILCAGTDGVFSEDDILLAGMLVERLQRLGGMTYVQNAQAIAAREFWLNSFALPQALGAEPLPPPVLAAQLARSPGGRNLIEIGRQDDLLTAAQIDRFQGVPRLDERDGCIRLA
jgi:2-phosphosulfolactate phosphatase